MHLNKFFVAAAVVCDCLGDVKISRRQWYARLQWSRVAMIEAKNRWAFGAGSWIAYDSPDNCQGIRAKGEFTSDCI